VKTGGALTAGYSHTCAINTSGVLKCWGAGFDGELGDGNATSSTSPIMPSIVGAPIFVGAGSSHTCAIVAGGKAFCWGFGFDGELGDGNATEEDLPSPVSSISNVLRIDGGGEHSCAIVNGGSVMCWGGNFYGDVGDGSGTERDTPVATSPTIGNALEVNAGIGDHACAVLSTGGVQCWGEDDYGECGDNATNFQDLSPVDVMTSSTTKLANASHVVLGNTHSCAILSNGDLVCWGDDTYGELGDGKTNTQSSLAIKATVVSGVTAVALGGDGFNYAHTCAIVAGGAVKCWGSNDFGQLGDGTTTASTTGVTAISSGAVAIAAGFGHSCAMKSDGSVYCWGYNGDGQLGIGNNTDSSTPVKVTGF
jgi:alpha-tubulin suppressor-like RCC1 family protein